MLESISISEARQLKSNLLNMLHDMETEDLVSLRGIANTQNMTLLSVLAEYVIELRDHLGKPNDKRPWRESDEGKDGRKEVCLV